MLSRARRLKADGIDVVIGLVETHGRGETAALLDGLEILPRRRVAHRAGCSRSSTSMRRFNGVPDRHRRRARPFPNPEDSRHPKRHQDIEELIAAGSMSGRRSTSSTSKALPISSPRSPASPFANGCPTSSSSVQTTSLLVDLAPSELIERLKEGKVYLPESANAPSTAFSASQSDGAARTGAAPHRRPRR